jgi:hypothetical protein
MAGQDSTSGAATATGQLTIPNESLEAILEITSRATPVRIIPDRSMLGFPGRPAFVWLERLDQDRERIPLAALEPLDSLFQPGPVPPSRLFSPV